MEAQCVKGEKGLKCKICGEKKDVEIIPATGIKQSDVKRNEVFLLIQKN